MPKQIKDKLEKSGQDKASFITEQVSEKTSKFVDVGFVIIVVFITLLLGGLIFAGWTYYLTLNSGNSASQKLDSPTNEPITKPPASLTLELEQPDDNTLSFQSSIVVSGSTRPNSSVMITSQSQDLVIESKKDGSFSTILNLDEGVNKLKVAVFDGSGDQREVEKTIYYSKEKI